MSLLQVFLLVILWLCFFASGFLSGSETAVVAIPRERIPQLRTMGKRGARLAALTVDMERTIGTVLIANNFVNILATTIATILATQLIDEQIGPIVSTLAVTAIVLVVGEITPKTLAARHPERYGLSVAPTLWVITKVLDPISRVFRAASRSLLLMFRVRIDGARLVTEDDIRALAALGEQAGEIDRAERQIIDSVLAAADRPIREVMTPRVDVVFLQEPVTMKAVREAVATTAHSRYPVVEEGSDLDRMIGVLYVKDIFRLRDQSPIQIRKLVRQPHVLPDSAALLGALQEIRARRTGFVVVADEHGGVDGILTAKDLVSDLVGDLRDEYDPGIPTVRTVEPGRWLTDGRLPVEELGEAIAVQLPDGPYATVGGLFLFAHGDIPVSGDSVDIDGVILTIERMDRLRIDRLFVDVDGDTRAATM